MKSKPILCLALVLSGAFVGCKRHPIPSPPSAEQVRAWAGFPDGFRLETVSELATKGDESVLGNRLWGYVYENSHHSLVSFEVSIFEPGTLWGTNRAKATEAIEKGAERLKAPKFQDKRKDAIHIDVLPNGQKVYFALMGFGPGGSSAGAFCYEHNYDLLVSEEFNAQHGIPPEKKTRDRINPTNDLPVVFKKVKEFVDAQ
jgi:hypothetical protein